jgi:hypothetical protein
MALLSLVTVAFFVAVLRLRRARRVLEATLADLPMLPAEDLPPATAVGWPPEGAAFRTYVDEGFAALDAYLSEGYAT